MLEKWNHNKNGTKDIGIQVFDEILQLGVGYRLYRVDARGGKFITTRPTCYVSKHTMVYDKGE